MKLKNKAQNFKIRIQYLFIIGIIFLFIGCGDKYNNHYAIVLREKREMPDQENKEEKVDNALLKANQVANEKELQQIKGYIQRRKWDMKNKENGVFVQMLEEGKGEVITSSSTAIIDCKIELIDGKKVFDSKIDGQKEVNLKTEQNVVGLVYVLNGIKQGSKLRAVIPSFLAYGLKGDDDRIPKRAALVYEIEVKEVK